MPVKRRKAKRKEPITENERRWLRGETPNGFVSFRDGDVLAALWADHGDKSRYSWKPGMYGPQPRNQERVRYGR